MDFGGRSYSLKYIRNVWVVGSSYLTHPLTCRAVPGRHHGLDRGPSTQRGGLEERAPNMSSRVAHGEAQHRPTRQGVGHRRARALERLDRHEALCARLDRRRLRIKFRVARRVVATLGIEISLFVRLGRPFA